MIRVKNGTVRITGSRRENAYDLGRLLTQLLLAGTLKAEKISRLLELAVEECEIIGADCCIGEPVFEEAEFGV